MCGKLRKMKLSMYPDVTVHGCNIEVGGLMVGVGTMPTDNSRAN